MIGGTKQAELERSAYLFKELVETQGIYFALMLLVDSGYNSNEIKVIADLIKSKEKAIEKTKVIHGFNCMCPASFCCPSDD